MSNPDNPDNPKSLAVANEEGDHEKVGSVAMRRAKRLDRQNTLVRSDVFLHNLDPFTLESLRRAIEQGLVPSGLNISGDDEPIVVLRRTRPPAR